MRKTAVTVALAVICSGLGVVAGGVVARASSTSTPEIDRANSTIQLSGTLKPLTCLGEDTTTPTYVTFHGAWKGSETQALPDPTDYGLSGALSVTGIQWTINTSTNRGVLRGTISLVNAAGTVEYAGKLILITQGFPAAGANVPGRGWIVAAFKPTNEGETPDDDNLLANVEWQINPSGSTGQFGDVPGSLGIPDFSVVTNVAPPLDGIC